MSEGNIQVRRRPVMVMAGSIRPGSTECGLVEGFRRLGWVVQQVDRDGFGVGIGRSFALRIAARMTVKSAVSAYQQRVIAECAVLRPDVLFTVKGIDLERPVLHAIKSSGVRTVMYYPDLAFNHRGVHQDSFECYDLFATTKIFQVPWLRQRLTSIAVEHVAHGHVDDVHAPVFAAQQALTHSYDALYAGNHSTYKQSWMKALLKLNPGLDLCVIGNRWRNQKPVLPIPASHMPGEVSGVGYAQAIQKARINIALHFGTTNSDWQDLVSTRTFEIPACGGFMLHIDNEEVREYFKPGREMDVFSTPEELDDKIRFYLARPDLREKMIVRAYERCVPAYGYASRAVELQQNMIKHGLVSINRF